MYTAYLGVKERPQLWGELLDVSAICKEFSLDFPKRCLAQDYLKTFSIFLSNFYPMIIFGMGEHT